MEWLTARFAPRPGNARPRPAAPIDSPAHTAARPSHDLAGFSHRGLALLAATIQLAEKEDDALRRFEPIVLPADHPMLSRAAAVLVVADALDRLIGDTPLLRCRREGRVLKLATSVAAPWPLQEPLRRLGQA